ncbi:hypothetical protein AJ79_04107 [Helicocarpus griseus UAMH5409]|uniref:Myb-like domain-containing protein n=1 Tax=Helicocarpus griseus UAMH5409 TaxID=1447875 RepID=A0A2B7XU64_9EURO|nr:hypothetical protein AJ79_04107 [Helicocarpus griseus UAMH5409]
MFSIDRPTKRARISESQDSNAADTVPEIDVAAARQANNLRLKSRFEDIFEKYGKDFSSVGDEIDLATGEIIIDNGHIERMKNEQDLGAQAWKYEFDPFGETEDTTDDPNETPNLPDLEHADRNGHAEVEEVHRGNNMSFDEAPPGSFEQSVRPHSENYASFEGSMLHNDVFLYKTPNGSSKKFPTTSPQPVDPLWQTPEIDERLFGSSPAPPSFPTIERSRTASPPDSGSLWALPQTRRAKPLGRKRLKPKPARKSQLLQTPRSSDQVSGSDSDDPLSNSFHPVSTPSKFNTTEGSRINSATISTDRLPATAQKPSKSHDTTDLPTGDESDKDEEAQPVTAQEPSKLIAFSPSPSCDEPDEDGEDGPTIAQEPIESINLSPSSHDRLGKEDVNESANGQEPNKKPDFLSSSQRHLSDNSVEYEQRLDCTVPTSPQDHEQQYSGSSLGLSPSPAKSNIEVSIVANPDREAFVVEHESAPQRSVSPKPAKSSRVTEPYTPNEIRTILTLRVVKKRPFKEVFCSIPGRTAGQLRHWYYVQSADIKKCPPPEIPWTVEDEDLLDAFKSGLDVSWEDLEERFEGRTRNQIQCKWAEICLGDMWEDWKNSDHLPSQRRSGGFRTPPKPRNRSLALNSRSPTKLSQTAESLSPSRTPRTPSSVPAEQREQKDEVSGSDDPLSEAFSTWSGSGLSSIQIDTPPKTRTPRKRHSLLKAAVSPFADRSQRTKQANS